LDSAIDSMFDVKGHLPIYIYLLLKNKQKSPVHVRFSHFGATHYIVTLCLKVTFPQSSLYIICSGSLVGAAILRSHDQPTGKLLI